MCVERDQAIVLRHSMKPDPKNGDLESPNFPGLSERGVELAAERAKEILEVIRQTPENAVVFIGAVSEMPRTRSTARALAHNLEELSKASDDDMVFIDQQRIEDETQGEVHRTLDFIRNTIGKYPTSRIILDFPLFLKQLSLEGSGLLAPEIDDLLDQLGDQDEIVAVREWVSSWNGGGKGQVTPLGPNPAAVAQDYSKAIERILTVGHKLIPDRPLAPLIIGHSWAIDVFLGYLAGGGVVHLEAFDDVTQGELIQPLEHAEVSVAQRPQVRYRDRLHQPTSS